MSKAVGDELEEQITFMCVDHIIHSLIEQLEDHTERAQSSSRKLHRNLKMNALQRERQSILLLNLFFISQFIAKYCTGTSVSPIDFDSYLCMESLAGTFKEVLLYNQFI